MNSLSSSQSASGSVGEIHDTLLQNLVALALHFESLARKLTVSSPALKEDVTPFGGKSKNTFVKPVNRSGRSAHRILSSTICRPCSAKPGGAALKTAAYDSTSP